MAQNETARTTVYLDGKQAEAALGALADKAKGLRKDLEDALHAGDNVKFNKLRAELGRVESAQRSVTKESFDVQNVLMNINKVSWRDLEKAQKAILSQLKNMVPATEEYIKKSEELRQVTTRIDSIRASTHATTGFMGRLTQSIGGMSGPVGIAINGMIAFGKTMWALVANPIGLTIAAIVGGLTLLYKAFTSTDSGAVAMEGALKAVGNVMDILLDRAMNVYKMIGAFVRLDFKGMKENAQAAFGGLGAAVKDAVNAGWEYAKAMDDINDREVAAANRMNTLRNEIELLKNKALVATGKERLAMLKQAMDKEIELNGIETGFLAQRNEVETKNLASKIQNDKLSIDQKEELLKKWLAIDDTKLAEAMANDSAFAEFENKNEAEYQALQKTKADELAKQAELQTGTRRLQSKLATEEKEELGAGAKAAEEAEKIKKKTLDAANAELKLAYEDRLLIIKNAYLNEGFSKEEYETRVELASIAHLEAQKQLLISQKLDITSIELEIADARIKIQTDAYTVIEEIAKKNEDKAKEQQQTIVSQIEETIKSVDDSINELDQIKKQEIDINQERAKSYLDLASSVGDSFADTLMSQEQDLGQFLRNTLVMALDALEKMLVMSIAETTLKDVTKKGFLGIATAAAKIVLLKAAFGTAKALVLGGGKGKQAGGYADNNSSDSTPVGVYHANEFIASGPAVRNPTIKPVLDIIDIAQRSGTIRSLNLPAMLGQSGRQSGGYASPASQSPGLPSSVISGRDPELISVIKELNYQLKAGIKASVNKFGHGGIDESISDINKFNGLTK